MRVASFLLFLATMAYGDELVLRDGSVVEWVTLRDEGDAYTVVTTAGHTKRVVKADIREFRKVIPKAVLTGATIEKRQKGIPRDLLAEVSPEMAVSGEWQVKEGRLLTPKEAHARIVLPAKALGECDIALQVRKLEGDGALYFGIPIKEKMLFVHFDGTDNVERGVGSIGSTLSRRKTFSKTGRPYGVKFIVRNGRFVALVDGKVAIDWRKPNYDIETLPEKIKVSKKGFMIGCYGTVYSIDKLSVVLR